jgi:hypothetical protein
MKRCLKAYTSRNSHGHATEWNIVVTVPYQKPLSQYIAETNFRNILPKPTSAITLRKTTSAIYYRNDFRYNQMDTTPFHFGFGLKNASVSFWFRFVKYNTP